jgi:hypothetical protein
MKIQRGPLAEDQGKKMITSVSNVMCLNLQSTLLKHMVLTNILVRLKKESMQI